LGNVYVNEDKLQDAEQVYRESLRIHKKAGDRTQLVVLLRNLASVYSLQARYDEALRVLQDALKIAKASPPLEPMISSAVINSIGVVHYRQGKVSKAEKMFNEAVQFLPESGTLFDRADLLNNLGTVYHAKRQFEKAEEFLINALKIIEGQIGLRHPDLTFSLSALGVLYHDWRKYRESEAQYRRALSILEGQEGIFDTRIARLLHSLSRTYQADGRKADAAAALSQANDIARRKAKEHPDMALIMEAYAETLKREGKAKEAEQLRVEARRVRTAAGLVVTAHTPF
jgi:tetratricopeptide (TPR) repeat protein